MGPRWRISSLALLLILALTTAGVGYGLWRKDLILDGRIRTGDVNAEWTRVGCFDIEAKDVGTTTAWIDPDNRQLLHFLIENGYPSYEGDCEVEMTSTGSIPVHVESIVFLPGAGLTNCTVDQSPTTGSFTARCDQLTVRWADGLCTQLHQGDFIASSLGVHVEQAASQSSQYEFSIEVQLNQFNESACP